MSINGPIENNLTKKQFLSEIELLQRKFDIIVNHAESVEIWVLPDMTVAFVSPGFEKITGFATEHFIKNPDLFAKIIHPDDLVAYNQHYQQFRESDLPAAIERRIIRSDGEIRWIHSRITKIYDDQGNYNGFRSSTTDITGRKMAELELQKAYGQLKDLEEKYRIVADNTYDLERWVLPDKTLAYISPSCERITGYSREEFMENPGLLKKIIHPDDSEWFFPEREQAFFNDSSFNADVRIINKKGETRWLGFVTQKVIDKDGNSLGLRSSSRDITPLKESEQRLLEAISEVESLKSKLEDENRYLREKILPLQSNDDLVSDSPLMLQVLEKVRQVAMTDAPVLLFGETGTGKEVIANAIHNNSKRRNRVMITVNCAALPASLIESELFGREKGAYTGALARQIGRFELANHSTIFLDEIGELPLEIQVKMLRVIQFGEFQMLGSPETKKVDVRIIAATNRDLSKAITDGTFRSDLFYRLNVFPVKVPALRERKEDIPLLAWTFVDEIAAKMGKHIGKISPQSMSAMLRYSWPGNVRELHNLIEYSIIINNNPTLVIHLPVSENKEACGENLEEQQRAHIEKVLNQTGWQIRGKSGAAEKLGMKESTLRFRMKKLGIVRKL